jgi:short-subunit dehydrogenase
MTASNIPNSSPVALITGASRGLGKAMALRFKQAGFIVIGIARNKPDVELDLYLQGDITEPDFRQQVMDEISSKYQKLDVLINNAGMGSYETWEKLSELDLKTVFELNFFAPVALTRLFLPLLKESRGCVLNVSSVAGKLYVPCMGAYCASKSALTMFSDSLRAELLNHRVQVLDILPGRINTGFSNYSLGNKKPPETPGGGDAVVFAEKVYSAYKKRKRRLYYPWWYRVLIPLAKCLPVWYEKENLKRWGI